MVELGKQVTSFVLSLKDGVEEYKMNSKNR